MSRLPFRVGLTGGIASGKSAVAAEFAKLGIPIIDADVLARDVVRPGQPALKDLVTHFGPEVVNAQGELDRARMRERVFNLPSEKKVLEAILHPAIRAAQQAQSERAGGPYQMHVIPLLIESGSKALYDRVLVVDCGVEVQLARLLERDGISRQLAEQMLAAQASREQRLVQADDVLENHGRIENLPQKVAFLHQRYLLLATAHDGSTD